MGTYKGTAGNLMQHWTLCELMAIAEEYVLGLSFIDAHAMAPVAHARTIKDDRFDRACGGLPGQQSVYERAWNQLVPNGGYPNSAAFVQQVWTRDFSMLLCEIDSSTITELDAWLPLVQGQPQCKRAKVSLGDWRGRFGKGWLNPSDVGLPDGSLTLISFDPGMYYPQPPASARAKDLYPCDLKLTLDALKEVKDGIIIQISTYSRGKQNQVTQEAVISSVEPILTGKGVAPANVVRLNRDMMSLVYARNVWWSAVLANLPGRFTKWLWNLDAPSKGVAAWCLDGLHQFTQSLRGCVTNGVRRVGGV